MNEYRTPVVVISRCVTFDPVRWDGGIVTSKFVEKLKSHVKFIPVCPEVEIGLGVPRDPLRIVFVNGERRLLQPSTGRDFTDKMNSFAESFLNSLDEVDGFVLKSGSPSSGFKNVKIYPKLEKAASVARGPGFFGVAVLAKFPYLPIEDERRLLNPRIQEHFLTKLFAMASFRRVKSSGSMHELVRFQSENKLLLTAYNQKKLRALGRIVANQARKPFDELVHDYATHLHLTFRRSPSVGSNINVLTKCMGYFSRQLARAEKAFFLESLEKYKAGRLPLSACTGVLRAWIVRFQQEYLASQTFLAPYPEELAAVDTVIAGDERKDYWK